MQINTSEPTLTDVPAYFHRARPEIVARAEPAGKRILDVGCAAGAMGAAMLAAGATEVVGIEVHAPAAAIARGRLTSVFGYDLEELPELPFPPGYFDVITLADVLEHLRDPLAVLCHLRHWLSGDGRIVCSLPNVRHESVLLPLLVHGQWNYVEAGILDRTHLRFFTLESMLRMLREAGYEPERQRRRRRGTGLAGARAGGGPRRSPGRGRRPVPPGVHGGPGRDRCAARPRGRSSGRLPSSIPGEARDP